MTQYVFKNAQLLDPGQDRLLGGHEVLVEGDTIKEVSAKPIKASKATVVNCGKRTLMPGLIDCHVHTHHSEVYINRMEAVPLTLMMARSAGRLKRMPGQSKSSAHSVAKGCLSPLAWTSRL